MRRVKNLVDATFNFKESADVCHTLEESLLPNFSIKYVFLTYTRSIYIARGLLPLVEQDPT